MEKKDKLNILLEDYKLRNAEVLTHTQQYQRQVQFVQIYGSIVAAISGVLLSESSQKIETQLSLSPTMHNLAYIFLLTLAAVIGFYLIAAAMDSLFIMQINGLRKAMIEKKINEEAGEELLNWESFVIPSTLDFTKFRYKSWVKPPTILGLWVSLVFALTNVLLCLLCVTKTGRPYSVTYCVFIGLAVIFHVYQFFVLGTVGLSYQRALLENREVRVSFQSTALEFKTRDSIDIPDHIHFLTVSIFRLFLRWPFIVTLMIGVMPMAILSLMTNSFWPSSPHQFPFSKIISVSVGDTLLLPIFNVYFYRLIMSKKNTLWQKKWVSLLICAILLIANFWIEYVIHKSWTEDSYTGFMDLVPGIISPAGWWHLAFSSIQTVIVLLFLTIWFLFRRDSAPFRLGTIGWKVLLAYFSLGIFDFLVKRFSTFRGLPLSYTLISEWPSAIKLVAAVSISIWASRFAVKQHLKQ